MFRTKGKTLTPFAIASFDILIELIGKAQVAHTATRTDGSFVFGYTFLFLVLVVFEKAFESMEKCLLFLQVMEVCLFVLCIVLWFLEHELGWC